MERKKILRFIFIALILFSAYHLTKNLKDKRDFESGQQTARTIKERLPVTVVDPREEEKETFRRLQEKIPPLVAWLTIPGTAIDFPVVQANDNRYYLTHDYKGKENRYGAPFLDKDNDPRFTDQNSIIYGHDDPDDRVFGSLRKLKELKNRGKAPVMELLTEHGKETYRIRCVYVVGADDNFRSVCYDAETWDIFTRRWEEKNLLKEPKPRREDQLLTLQTCDGNVNRLVIHGVRETSEL